MYDGGKGRTQAVQREVNSITISTASELEQALAQGGGALEMAVDLRVVVVSGHWTISCAPGFHATIELRGNATVEAFANCRVEASEHANTVVWADATVIAREESTVEAWQNARVEAFGNSGVIAYERAEVIAMDRSRVELWDDATAEAWGTAVVVAWGNARVVARERANVELREKAVASVREFSRVSCRETSSVEAGERSMVEASGNSLVIARENCTVEARENARVEAWGNCIVTARDTSQVVARGNILARLYGAATIDASSNTVVMTHRQASQAGAGPRHIAAGRPASTAEWCEFFGVEMRDGTAILFQSVDADFSNEEARRAGVAFAPGTIPRPPGGVATGYVLRAASHPKLAKAEINPGGVRAIACPVRLDDIHFRAETPFETSVSFRGCCAPVYEVDWDGNHLQQR